MHSFADVNENTCMDEFTYYILKLVIAMVLLFRSFFFLPYRIYPSTNSFCHIESFFYLPNLCQLYVCPHNRPLPSAASLQPPSFTTAVCYSMCTCLQTMHIHVYWKCNFLKRARSYTSMLLLEHLILK